MNTASDTSPKTLQEAIEHFADYQNAHDFMVKVRWPSGQVCCPACGSVRVRYICTRKQWECREQHAKRRFSLKTGTIMEDSPLALKKWLAALWLEVNAKNSISSWETHRALGVTQKTAWFMLHRIRHALHVGSFDKKLAGVVEADETYVGGLSKNMHKSRRQRLITGPGVHGKTAVMGLLERHSDKKHSLVRAEVVKSTSYQALYRVIHKHVEPGTSVYSDAHKSYRQLSPEFIHDFVDHAEAYVKNKVVHTNGLENFWCLFKRCIKGTHVSVEPFHLAAYVDSEAFRFNNRDLKDGSRFVVGASGFKGKRLTYKALIGASEDYTSATT